MDAKAQRRRGYLWFAIGCISVPIVTLIAGIVIIRVTFDRYRQTAVSMEPTIVKGDVVLVRPVDRIERSDLVVVRMPTGGTAVKRVIALPGELVELRDNNAIVDGVPLNEPYAALSDDSLPETALFRDMPPQRLTPGDYFVLGDNRDNSNDSRFIGPVQRDDVRGRVVFVISARNGMWRP